VIAPARIRVRIDRLVVDGAPGVRADLLATSISDELARLAGGRLAAVEVPRELRVDLVRDPDAGGREIAAALHARLMTEIADA
jgi:hypothetical protein